MRKSKPLGEKGIYPVRGGYRIERQKYAIWRTSIKCVSSCAMSRIFPIICEVFYLKAVEKMELFDSEVIFSIKFPVESPENIEKEYGNTVVNMQSFRELLHRISEKYVYTPRPEAGKKIKWFLEYAMMASIDFEINTEVRKSAHQISVSMDIGYRVFYGPMKKALEKLIVFADDFSLSARKDNPDSLILSIAYYTHERHAKEEA